MNMSGLLGKLRRVAQVAELAGGHQEQRVALRKGDPLLGVLVATRREELHKLRRAGVRRVHGQFAPPDHVLTLALP